MRRKRQTDLYEFEASLVYKVSSRTVGATQRNLVSKIIYIYINLVYVCASVYHDFHV